jgi:putative ABC transport system substrate-binding protein
MISTICSSFPVVADPVGAGYVDSLARPGGNATGFTNFEYSLAGKWLELPKQIAPGVARVAVLRDARHTLRPRPVRRDPSRSAIA